MPLPLKLALFAVGLVALWALFRWRFPRPDFMPLETKPDDPILLQAMSKARASLPEFLERLAQPRDGALVKLRFVSSTDQVEHLWAEVVEVLGPTELGVRLVTPPVTHAGLLDRMHRCSLADVEDWHVRDTAGKVHGGFTQRAMFAIARRDGIQLPTQLAAQEREYSDV